MRMLKSLRLFASNVADLPAASSANKGQLRMVNDATATTVRSTVAGGGANVVIVVSNGTNWVIVS